MGDGIGLAEALLGLSGFSVPEVTEANSELVIVIETVDAVVGCGPRRRTACPSRSATWPASAGPRAWCGASGDGAASTSTARPRRGRRPPSTSRLARC
jgi:hypothetical protein